MILRILLLIGLIILAIPLYNKGKEYWDEKIHKVKVIGESLEKTARYAIGKK